MFSGTITAGETQMVGPFGRSGVIYVNTDQDLILYWWNDALGDYNPSGDTVTTPGDETTVAGKKLLIEVPGETDAHVDIAYT